MSLKVIPQVVRDFCSNLCSQSTKSGRKNPKPNLPRALIHRIASSEPQMDSPLTPNTRYRVITSTGKKLLSRKEQAKDTEIAIKMRALTPGSLSKPKEEARILHYLSSLPNTEKFCVMEFHSYWESSECAQAALVTEKLRVNLEDYQKEFQGCTPLKDLAKIARQLTLGLDFLKRHHVLHRDLKPHNIMLTKEGCVKIIDFGLAFSNFKTEEEEVLSKEHPVQTLAYRAPEVALELEYGHRADLWSLGVTLAELFLNSPLFPIASEEDLLHLQYELLGPLPKEWVLNSPKSRFLFQRHPKQACFRRPLSKKETSLSYKKHNLEKLLREKRKVQKEEADLFKLFSDFLSKVISYKRPSVEELLNHPFLLAKEAQGMLPKVKNSEEDTPSFP